MIFWPAVTMASIGKIKESLSLLKKVFALDSNRAVLLPRLPQVGQFPNDKKLLKEILKLAPQQGR